MLETEPWDKFEDAWSMELPCFWGINYKQYKCTSVLAEKKAETVNLLKPVAKAKRTCPVPGLDAATLAIPARTKN